MKYQTGTKTVEEPVYERPSDVYFAGKEAVAKALGGRKILAFRVPLDNEWFVTALGSPNVTNIGYFAGSNKARFIVENQSNPDLDAAWE